MGDRPRLNTHCREEPSKRGLAGLAGLGTTGKVRRRGSALPGNWESGQGGEGLRFGNEKKVVSSGRADQGRLAGDSRSIGGKQVAEETGGRWTGGGFHLTGERDI